VKEKRSVTRVRGETQPEQSLGPSSDLWPFPPWPRPVKYGEPPLSDRIQTFADMTTEVGEAPF
jgi:hypothetical protein